VVEHFEPSELNRIFSALADPTRRAILRGLTRGPATINQIAKPFPFSLNAVSKHVIVLERAGLLRREIKGRQHYCSIEPRALREADHWLQYYHQFWEQRMDALQAYVARKYPAKRRAAHGKGG
jgi:DNA-binding transcriptional ArsR family regulator